MVRQGIVLGHVVSRKGIEVDKAKINIISNLPPLSSVKGVWAMPDSIEGSSKKFQALQDHCVISLLKMLFLSLMKLAWKLLLL